MFNFVRMLPVLFVLFTVGAAAAFEVSALSVPESFIVDEADGHYYISNISGGPLEKNNTGFITKLDPAGRVIKKKLVEGGRDGVTLNAPKGLLVSGNTLYVADIDYVRVFDKKSGVKKADIDLTSFHPKFLNDLATDGSGKIFVTDMGSNRIFAIDTAKQNRVSVLASDEKLASPNGILFHKKRKKLIINTWDSGKLFWVDLKGNLKKYTDAVLDTGLDGIDFDGEGGLFVSSFTGGKIFHIDKKGNVKVIAADLVTPADISLDRKKRLILVPSFKGDRAFTLDY